MLHLETKKDLSKPHLEPIHELVHDLVLKLSNGSPPQPLSPRMVLLKSRPVIFCFPIMALWLLSARDVAWHVSAELCYMYKHQISKT